MIAPVVMGRCGGGEENQQTGPRPEELAAFVEHATRSRGLLGAAVTAGSSAQEPSRS